ncbi:MAG: aminoacyl-tRNA hydrolase [Candidatus Nealsonbacteria bacterium]|nr:aminoacyl-tRNA hydrolase [Candidatus Nealsonbacteria bacterium]
MILIVGLGNPGEKYENTRHNVGFMVVEQLRKDLNLADFDFDKKSNSFFSKNIDQLIIKLDASRKIDLFIVKPDTFMNLSGQAVSSLINFYKINEANKIIIHDDIDLLIGQIKISKDRGSAGHKGVESIIKNLGTKNFIRIRIGIKPKSGKPKKTEDFVLKKFSKEEKEVINEIILKSVEAIRAIIKDGPEKAMSIFNN